LFGDVHGVSIDPTPAAGTINPGKAAGFDPQPASDIVTSVVKNVNWRMCELSLNEVVNHANSSNLVPCCDGGVKGEE
jgi:hypothetical protein